MEKMTAPLRAKAGKEDAPIHDRAVIRFALAFINADSVEGT
jgi:hypothetical protein